MQRRRVPLPKKAKTPSKRHVVERSALEEQEEDRRRSLPAMLPRPDVRSMSGASSLRKKKHNRHDQYDESESKTPFRPMTPMKSSSVSRLFPRSRQDAEATVGLANAAHQGSSSSSASAAASSSSSAVSFESAFQVLGVLGSGSFANVFLCRSRTDGATYAVKKTRKPFRGASDRQRCLAEAEHFRELSETDSIGTCVRFIRAWDENGYLFIQMAMYSKGSLKRLLALQDPQHGLPEDLVWAFLADLTLALDHVHEMGRVHHDLKPDNVFVTEALTLRIGDFGIARHANSSVHDWDEGDPAYLAPEVLDDGLGMRGKPSDIFSLGLIAFEMAAHVDLPSSGADWQRLRRGDVPALPHRSSELAALVSVLLAREPSARPTARKLLQHPKLRRHSQLRRRDPRLSRAEMLPRGIADVVVRPISARGLRQLMRPASASHDEALRRQLEVPDAAASAQATATMNLSTPPRNLARAFAAALDDEGGGSGEEMEVEEEEEDGAEEEDYEDEEIQPRNLF